MTCFYLVFQVTDHTHKASSIRAEIVSVLEHLPQSSEDHSTLTQELEALTRDTALQILIDKLVSKDIEDAVYLLRTLREKFGAEKFGKSDDDNLDVLLTLYCRQVAERNVGSLTMSCQATQFTLLCSELMDVNMSALTALEELVFP